MVGSRKILLAVLAAIVLTAINQVTTVVLIKWLFAHELMGFIGIFVLWGMMLFFTIIYFYTIPYKVLGIRKESFYLNLFMSVVAYCTLTIILHVLNIFPVAIKNDAFIINQVCIANMPLFCLRLFGEKYFPKKERKTRITKMNP